MSAPVDLAVSAQLAKDDHFSLNPGDQSDTISALDAAFADASKPVAGAGDVTPTPEAAAAAEKASADKAAAEKATADQAAADKVAADKAAAGTPTPEEAAAAEKAAADKAAADKAAADKAAADKAAAEATKTGADDVFDKLELPPHTSPKAKDAFAALKKAAQETRGALSGQVTELSTKLAAAEKQIQESANKTLSPEVEQELTDLRKFHLAHEVESDPTFRQYDGQITSNIEAIYSKLKQVGVTEDHIAKIKELGGPASIDWEPLLAKLPFTARTYVQGKLVDNETIADKRTEALAKAKEGAQEFLKERQTREVSELTDAANGLLKTLPWTAEQSIPATSSPEQRAAMEAQNKAAKEYVGQLKTFLSDRSPARVAELAVGTVMAYKFKADLDSATAKVTTLEADLKAKTSALTAERDALKLQLDELKKAEVGPRRGEVVVPAGGGAPKKGEMDFRDGNAAFEQYEKEFANRS